MENSSKSNRSKKLMAEDFVNSPRVLDNIAKLAAAFGKNGERLIVSDTLDKNGHQYVNLVQKGGGVLGIALVGYTYVLEKMGIRFMRLAGTSAGAINTALLTVIDNKEDKKSEKVLEVITQLDFFNLVDGHRAARWFIKKFITRTHFLKRFKKWWIGTGIFYSLLLISSFVCLWLLPANRSMVGFTQTLVIILLLATFMIGFVALYLRNLLKRFTASGFGVNPGNYFYDWLKRLMMDHGVNSVGDFNNKASKPIDGLHLRSGNLQGLTDLNPDVTLIASEIITENKIEFPRMCNLFRPLSRINEIHPAGMVRASMAIPVFFESYFIHDIPKNDPEIKSAWKETFGNEQPPAQARFVDGGILSNFPISIFYNPKITKPRLPLFGIDLDDTDPKDKKEVTTNWTFGGYFFRIFNTVRNYYDKDFQLKNRVYSRGIGTIPLPEFNWLNFFITDREKLKMFERGVEAATNFLLGFDWEAYKNERMALQEDLKEESPR